MGFSLSQQNFARGQLDQLSHHRRWWCTCRRLWPRLVFVTSTWSKQWRCQFHTPRTRRMQWVGSDFTKLTWWFCFKCSLQEILGIHHSPMKLCKSSPGASNSFAMVIRYIFSHQGMVIRHVRVGLFRYPVTMGCYVSTHDVHSFMCSCSRPIFYRAYLHLVGCS